MTPFSPQQLNIPRITLFLAAGIAIADGLRDSIQAPCWAFILAAVCAASWFFRRKETLCSVALLTAWTALGALVMSADWSGRRIALPTEPVEYKAVVCSEPIQRGNHWTCDILTYGSGEERKLKACIYDEQPLKLGDCLECVSTLREPTEYLPNSAFNYSTYLKRHGYAATTFLYEQRFRRIEPEYRSFILSLRLLRKKLTSILRKSDTPQQDFAIIAAMTLGEKSYLSTETKNDFTNAGAAHVLALSGLHLSIILSIVSFLLFFAGKKTETAVTLVFVWAFVLLTGMPISLIRVALMFTVMMLAETFGRQPHSLNSLSLAAFVILIVSPQSLYDMGFQLSFIAVASILLMSKRFRPSAFQAIILAPLAAQISVMPLIFYYFETFPTYFLLTNLFIFLFATAVIALSILTIALSFAPPLTAFLQDILALTAAAMNSSTHLVAYLPYSTIDGIRVNLPQLICAYILLAALYGLIIRPHLLKTSESF